MSMPSEQFFDAVKRVEALTVRPSNEQLLELYGLYKQVTVGDVNEDRPTGWDFKAIAKYDAWAKQKGVLADAAEAKYVAQVDGMVR